MALFSQRFWLKLSTLDSRVVAAHRVQQAASSRLLIGRKLVTGSSLIEYWSELKAATRDAQIAIADLNHFCAGRSRLRGATLAEMLEEAAEPPPAPLLIR